MTTYGERLKEAIQIAKSSRRALGEALGVSVQAIGDVINGKTKAFTAENNAKAATFLRVDATWLAIGEGEPRPPLRALPGGRATQEPATVASAPAEVPSGVKGEPPDLIIVQYQAGGAMGHGLILEEAPPGFIKSWRVDHEWLRHNVQHHTGVKNLCIVTGFGPSMKPRFNPGDPLLLDRGVTVVETDGIYFFRVGNHGFIKQLQRIPTEDGILLRAKSFNPDYDPFTITSKMDFEVFGKVLTVWRSEQM